MIHNGVCAGLNRLPGRGRVLAGEEAGQGFHGLYQFRVRLLLRLMLQAVQCGAHIRPGPVVHLRRVAFHPLSVQVGHQLFHIFRPVFDDGAIFVLIPQHQAVIAVGNFLETAAHGTAASPGAQYFFHQVVHFFLGKGGESGGVIGFALPLAHLGVIIIPDAVGPASGFFRNTFEDGFEGQALLLRFVGGFPEKSVFVIAPSGAAVHTRHDLFHMSPSKLLLIKSMRVGRNRYTKKANIPNIFSQREKAGRGALAFNMGLL